MEIKKNFVKNKVKEISKIEITKNRIKEGNFMGPLLTCKYRIPAY